VGFLKDPYVTRASDTRREKGPIHDSDQKNVCTTSGHDDITKVRHCPESLFYRIYLMVFLGGTLLNLLKNLSSLAGGHGVIGPDLLGMWYLFGPFIASVVAPGFVFYNLHNEELLNNGAPGKKIARPPGPSLWAEFPP
jgi:hypothetical protein